VHFDVADFRKNPPGEFNDSHIWHYMSMKPSSEIIEGPEAVERFDALVRRVLSVQHAEIMRREEKYKRQSLANPNRRGPKPKAKVK